MTVATPAERPASPASSPPVPPVGTGLELPPSRGIVQALWSLATPLKGTPARPAHRGLRYREGGSLRAVAPRVDVYLPRAPGPRPSVVLVHGGGFVIGARDMKPMRLLATHLVGAGFAVASIDYRLIFRGGRADEALADVADAVRWWRGQAGRFALDPGRVSMAGMSAGAALIWLHAATTPDPIERIVSVYGVYDFAWLGGGPASLMRSLLLRSRDVDIWRARSPVERCVSPAPSLLIHGTDDTLVPLAHAHALHARRVGAGLPSEIEVYEGQPHGFMNQDGSVATDHALRRILGFLAG